MLAAEAALVSGQTAAAAPDAPDAQTSTESLKSPSEQEIRESDLAWAAEHTKGSIAWAVTRAKTTRKKTVATDETTPTTHTVANPDGTLTTELTAGPERVWKNGSWQRADAAATYQSPGLPAGKDGQMPAGKNGGGECVQTVAAKTDDGSDHLLDDTRYSAPTWDETCGRSSMSTYINSGAMSGFGSTFAPGFRLLDKDVYRVNPGNTPGMDWFNSCDTTKPEVICTMSRP